MIFWTCHNEHNAYPLAPGYMAIKKTKKQVLNLKQYKICVTVPTWVSTQKKTPKKNGMLPQKWINHQNMF